MDIYHDDGTDALVDLGKARHELKASGSVTHEGTRRAIVAEITAAALLDIAYSLRPIGAEAADAMRAAAATTTLEEGGTPITDETRDFLVVGDLVAPKGGGDPGEVLSFGFDQGAHYALVAFVNGEERKVWLDGLERIRESAPGPAVVEHFVSAVNEAVDTGGMTGEEIDAALGADAEDEKMPTFIVEKTAAGVTIDELDDDFAGVEEHGIPPVSPLDALAEKAAKKKGKKK